MNKSSIYFAFFLSFVAFLFSCSEEKSSTPADLCKNGASKDCLVGEWSFNGIQEENPNMTCWGNLALNENNRYRFGGGCADIYEIDVGGDWSLEGANIRIDCNLFDGDGNTRRGTVTVSSDGMTISIRSETSTAAISLYQTGRVLNPTEKFIRK